jgi:hypothetical protein
MVSLWLLYLHAFRKASNRTPKPTSDNAKPPDGRQLVDFIGLK